MSKKYYLFIVGFLVLLNIFCWKEVFVLADGGKLKVNFLSVGQGDSELIETPDMHKILIDGGPDSTVLSKLNSLPPFWDKTIDVVILTHPDSDHMTGILDVLQRYNVKYFLWNGIVKDDAEDHKLAELLNKDEMPRNNFLASLTGQEPTKVLTIHAGEEIKAGNVLIDTLYPFSDLSGKIFTSKDNDNDTGIVDKLIYGKTSFLFTADIDSKGEKEIVDSGENILADILKVAHHGSKYSTSDLFLNSVNPKIAVIEVGKNTYGHPTPEVLQRLQKSGIKMFRTDKDGDVHFVSDGNNIKLEN